MSLDPKFPIDVPVGAIRPQGGRGGSAAVARPRRGMKVSGAQRLAPAPLPWLQEVPSWDDPEPAEELAGRVAPRQSFSDRATGRRRRR